MTASLAQRLSGGASRPRPAVPRGLRRASACCLLSLAVGGLAPGAAAAADEGSLAQIDAVLVDGASVTEPLVSQIEVLEAESGNRLAGEPGTQLSDDDEVRTGDGVEAVIRYHEADDPEHAEVLLAANSHVRISGGSSITGLLGRLLATLDGFFEVVLGSGVRFAAQGTEFEVGIDADETADLRVLVGEVDVRGAGGEAAAGGGTAPILAGPGSHLGISVEEGEAIEVESVLRVRNRCPRRHSFALAGPPDLGWVRVEAADGRVRVGGRDRVYLEFLIVVDATEIAAGRYPGELTLSCLDCWEPGCDPDPEAHALVIYVVAQPVVERLQRVVLKKGEALPEPAQMEESEVLSVLAWTDQVLIGTQPSYSAAHEPPHFDSVKARSEEFTAARRAAILQDSAQGRKTLGDVYSDWGDHGKARIAYREAAAAEADWATSPDLLTRRGVASRRAGRLDEAQELLERALAADPANGRAHNALGNLFIARAAAARDRDEPRHRRWLRRALEEFQTAARLSTSDPSDAGAQRTFGVAATNAGRVFLARGEDWIQSGEPERAEQEFARGEEYVREARGAYPDYPFALLAQGRLQQRRGRLAGRRGQQPDAERAFDQAELLYQKALESHPDLAPAYYDLGTLWEDRGPAFRDRALEQYQRSIRQRPSYAPAYFKLGTLVQDKDPGLASRYYGAYLKLERADLRQGAQAKEARKQVEARPRPLKVPPVVGFRKDRAMAALREAGFIPRIRRDGNRVKSQDPGADESALPGSEVWLTLVYVVD